MVPQHRHRRQPGARVTPPVAVRHRPRDRHRRRRSRGSSSACSAWSRWCSSRSASPRCGTSPLGSAMLAVRANERSAAGARRQRRAGQGRQLRHGVVHRRPRRQPARLPPARRHLRLVHRPRRPRAARPPPTSPASRRCGAASSPGSSRPRASCSSPSTAGSTSATWFPVITGVAPDRHPDHQPRGHRRLPATALADRWARWQRERRAATRTTPGGRRRSSRRRPSTPCRSPRTREAVAALQVDAPHRALRRRGRRRRRVARGRRRPRSSGSSAPTAPARRA